jgi:Protein of unknown function (DUF3306)
MTEREDFLTRWSRLKKAGAATSSDPHASASGQATAASTADATATATANAAAGAASTTFDIASLPPIESLTAQSDIRPFMQAGVPAQLQKAALRAAWAADPAIRDFIGIADSQWDFNDPAAMPGFGPLEGTENAQLFAQRAAQLRTGPATLPTVTQRPTQPAGSQRDGQLDRVWLTSTAPERNLARAETHSPPAVQPVIAPDTQPRPQPDLQQPVGGRHHGTALPKLTR